jgi:hypothetical protein
VTNDPSSFKFRPAFNKYTAIIKTGIELTRSGRNQKKKQEQRDKTRRDGQVQSFESGARNIGQEQEVCIKSMDTVREKGMRDGSGAKARPKVHQAKVRDKFGWGICPRGTGSAKSALYLEVFFSEKSGTPPPLQKRKFPF